MLLVRMSALGDIVHTVPAQQNLSRDLSETEIHWLVEPAYLSLVERIPGITRIWVADTKQWRHGPKGGLRFLRLIRSLRKESFEVAIDFQGLVKSALIARLTGAGRILGFDARQARETAASWFYSDRIPIGQGRKHRIELNLELAAPFLTETSARAEIPFDPPVVAVDKINRCLADLHGKQPILLNPGAGWKTKLWPPSSFARLAEKIDRQLKIPVVFTYGPGEETLIEEIRAVCCQAKVRAFQTSIPELAALCRRVRVVVASDTGPLHLAVAMGTPTVALMGPTFPWRNGPFNRADISVTTVQPCPVPYRKRCLNHHCMDMSVKDVFDAVQRRLERLGSGRDRPASQREKQVK